MTSKSLVTQEGREMPPAILVSPPQTLKVEGTNVPSQRRGSIQDAGGTVPLDRQGSSFTTAQLDIESAIRKCELPPAAVYGPVEDVVASAVEAQHLLPKNSVPPLVDAYRGLTDTLRSKKDLEMVRYILLALRTSGKGKTLTYLTQSASTHASLIHLVVRLNPYELNVKDETAPDYGIADAQLHLLFAIVSSNSVFLVPTMTSLWKFLAVKVEQAPPERYVVPTGAQDRVVWLFSHFPPSCF